MEETAVLLSTYNGTRFLKCQIDSLFEQTYKDFLIIARDDGSSDETRRLLLEFANGRLGQRLVIVDDNTRLGACLSFNRLLDTALKNDRIFRYFAFCDQDDWWHSDKLQKMIGEMKIIEKANPSTPVLVHCDLEVVDERLKTIAPSYWRYQYIDPEEHRIKSLLIKNTTVGCAMIINRELAKLAFPFPEEAIMHDWWITLAAAAAGKTIVVPKRFVKYRQHSKNIFGAKERGVRRFLRLSHWKNRIFNTQQFSSSRNFEQADAFYKRFSERLNTEDARSIKMFSDFKELSYIEKRCRIIKSGILSKNHFKLITVLLKP
jgi:glycosyltransferase involved in cell wall biosynthesis